MIERGHWIQASWEREDGEVTAHKRWYMKRVLGSDTSQTVCSRTVFKEGGGRERKSTVARGSKCQYVENLDFLLCKGA